MKLKLYENSNVFYHGSPYKLEYLKEGCDFTPYKEIAVAFGSKPLSLSINEDIIYFNPSVETIYLYIIDEEIVYNLDYIDRPNSSLDKGMELRTKRNLKLKLIQTISNIKDYAKGVTNENK